MMTMCLFALQKYYYLLTYLSEWSWNKEHKMKLLFVAVSYLGFTMLDNLTPDGLMIINNIGAR